jgi:hypothetical protein
MERQEGDDTIIDECTFSEWYTAHVFSKLFPDEYRYDGTRNWSYWDRETQQWVHDKNRHHLKTRLRLDMAQRLLKRAKHWQQKVATKEVEDMHTASLMIQRLLTISQKLQTDNFLGKMIRELQEHYCR